MQLSVEADIETANDFLIDLTQNPEIKSLIIQLRKAVIEQKPLRCKDLIAELDENNYKDEVAASMNQIKSMIKHFEFEKALIEIEHLEHIMEIKG